MLESIKDFLYIHPWWRGFLTGASPTLVSSGLTIYFGIMSSKSGGKVARLREELGEEVSRIANLQRERAKLQARNNELEEEKTRLLAEIAKNTKQPETVVQQNVSRLKKHLRELAVVTEGSTNWGAAAEIAEVENDIVTLFVAPNPMSPGSAFYQQVHCADIQIIEVPMGACTVRLNVLKRYGLHITLSSDIKKWEDRNKPGGAPRPRGPNVASCNFHKVGTDKRRGLYIYAPVAGNPEFTMATFDNGEETSCIYGDALNISRKFALQQIDYRHEGFTGAGSTKSGREGLYVLTS